MKTLKFLSVLFFFLVSFSAKSQTDKNINPVCAKKGHVKPATGVLTTLMLCPSKIIETSDSTVRVCEGCNTLFYNCMRCHKGISEKEKETRVTIWRKEK